MPSPFPWESWILLEFMEFHGNSQNSVKCVEFMISEEIPAFQWNAPKKHQLNLWFRWCSGVGAEGTGFALQTMESAELLSLQRSSTSDLLVFMISWELSPFCRRSGKAWYSYRIIEVFGVPFPAKSPFSWKSWYLVKFTDFRENQRISREFTIFTKMRISPKVAPRKPQ